jgi:hypothetical protein
VLFLRCRIPKAEVAGANTHVVVVVDFAVVNVGALPKPALAAPGAPPPIELEEQAKRHAFVIGGGCRATRVRNQKQQQVH